MVSMSILELCKREVEVSKFKMSLHGVGEEGRQENRVFGAVGRG